MFGNMLNSGQVESLIAKKEVDLRPFDRSRFRLAHYALTPAVVSTIGDLDTRRRRKLTNVHDFNDEDDYVFDGNQYSIIQVAEYIRLPDGIVGHFVPSSTLVMNGFGLNSGKIDPGYGNIKGATQKLVLGVKNLLDRPNIFSSRSTFVYMYLLDLRGLGNGEVDFTAAEFQKYMTWSKRFNRANDDGVNYGE